MPVAAGGAGATRHPRPSPQPVPISPELPGTSSSAGEGTPQPRAAPHAPPCTAQGSSPGILGGKAKNQGLGPRWTWSPQGWGCPTLGGRKAAPALREEPEGPQEVLIYFFSFLLFFIVLEMATHPRREPHAPTRPACTQATASYPKIKPKKTQKKGKEKKKKKTIKQENKQKKAEQNKI